MMKIVGAVVLVLCASAAWAAGPPDAATWARFGKIEEARQIYLQGVSLLQAGNLSEATKIFAKVLEIREGVYPLTRYPQGHTELTNSLDILGLLYEAQGDYAKAEPLCRRALETRERLYPITR